MLAAPEHKSYLPLLIALLVAALFLFAAAILSAFACRPIDYFVGGYEPKYLSKSATDLTWMLRYATDDVQARIDANREALAAGAKKVTWAMWLAAFSVFASAAAFFTTQNL